MRRVMFSFVAVAIASSAAVASVACSKGSERCVSGASVACACVDGRKGAQTCQDDGRFGPCRCEAAAGPAVTGAATPPPPPAPAVSPAPSPAAAAAALPACPDDGALVAVLEPALGKRLEVMACEPCRTPQGRWLVDALGSPDHDPALHTVLVDPAGPRVVARLGTESVPPAYSEYGATSYRCLDLDGDGTDEVIVTFSWDKGGYSGVMHSILRFGQDKLDKIWETRGSESNDAAVESDAERYSCTVWLSITAPGPDGLRRIVRKATYTQGKRASGDKKACAPGTTAYVHRGGKLEAVAPKDLPATEVELGLAE